MQNKAEKPILIIYLLGFVLLTLVLVLNQPLANTPPLFSNPPDEHARYLVPRYICEHGTIPTGLEEEIRIPSYGFSYGLYNVFPYIVQGYVMRLISLFTEVEATLLYAARMVNVFFGTCMAVIVYLLSKRVFDDRRFQWLFCFAITYLPQNIFLHSYVNTDSCCLLSTAMMLYGLVCGYQEGMNRKSSLWMSGGIILCALSYYNAYGYILSCILLFLAYFFRKRDGRISYDWKMMLKKGLFISAIVLLGISWWFVRSYMVLDGDFLGLATREKMSELYGNEFVNLDTYQAKGYTIWQMIKERNTLGSMFYGFVAAYGSQSIFGGIGLYRAFKILFGAGALGLLWSVVNKSVRVNRGEEKLCYKKLFFHLNMLFCILMPLILTIHYAYTMDYQDQGRYLLPALIPFMYYVVKGVEKLLKFEWRKFCLPETLKSAGSIVCFLVILISTLDMIFFRAIPIYAEIGMVLR